MQTAFLRNTCFAAVLGALLLTGCVSPQNGNAPSPAPAPAAKHALFENLPEGFEPKEVGARVAQNFLRRNLELYRGRIAYPEVCTAFGALRFAGKAGDKDLENQLVDRYAPVLTPEGSVLVATNRHVDFHVFGILPLEIYQLRGGGPWLELGLSKADEQWEDPWTNGLTGETRWWVDDCFMVGSLQIQAYRATRDIKYANRAATELVAYLDKLQTSDGLFYHSETSHHYWGRGNGWAAAALADVLDALPLDHPLRPRLMAGYRKQMDALKTWQSSTGRWRQIVDRPLAWEESSCTGMFTYALVMGLKHGWLDEDEYRNVALKGWMGLCRKIDEIGQVHDVCVGTNQKDDEDYYMQRPRATGDLHGQAPVLWCAWAMLDATAAGAKRPAAPEPLIAPSPAQPVPPKPSNPVKGPEDLLQKRGNPGGF